MALPQPNLVEGQPGLASGCRTCSAVARFGSALKKKISPVVGAGAADQVWPRLANAVPPNVDAATLVALATLNAATTTVLPNPPSSIHGP